ncbi:hypothetical protein IWZ01DRAFT_198754 [Phyllosticta capitalensis]
MPFGWRRRNAPDQDAALEKPPGDHRPRKRDYLRQLFSSFTKEIQERWQLRRTPSPAEHPLHQQDSPPPPRRKFLVPEPVRGTLKKRRRSRATLTKLDHDRTAAAPSARSISETLVTPAIDGEHDDDAQSDVIPEERSSLDQRDLTAEDIPKLFSGAPRFAVERTKGRRAPKVDFPFDQDVNVLDVSDCPRLPHAAFAAATLRPHLCDFGQQTSGSGPLTGYEIDVVEMPSMLSAQGLEIGTIGVEHFLEEAKADRFRTQEEDEEAFLNRELLQSAPEKLGIKWLDQRFIYERLMELSRCHQTYRDSGGQTTILNTQSTGELYAHLFGKFLMPPRFDGSTGDPTGLKVQIETLIRILRTKGIWRDFSTVEWRIRLGQLLWEGGMGDSEEEHFGGPCERDMLLLQILLASELLLRLDAISGLSVQEVTDELHLTAAEVRNFANMKTRKTDWDLVLARRFMENVEIIEEEPAPLTPKRRGFLAALNYTRIEESDEPRETEFWLRPRHRDRQLSGLLFFAESLGWANLSELTSSLNAKLQDIPTPATTSIYGTPLATPLASPRSVKDSGGYFDDAFRRPDLSRLASSRSVQLQPSVTPPPPPSSFRPLLLRRDTSVRSNDSKPPDIGGWLSRTYLSGLVLPGEPISHLLMSTLLENDKLAVAALGDSANLYGGFLYSGRSWWSKSSVIGRVLGAIEGAKECIGWISTPCVPEGFHDMWVDVVNAIIPPSQGKKSKARIEQADQIAKDSDYLAGKQANAVSEEDLSVPRDLYEVPVSDIRFTKLALSPETPPPSLETHDSDTDETPTPTYSAHLTFTSPETSTTLALTYDVNFITAFPCTPTPNNKFLRLCRGIVNDNSGASTGANNSPYPDGRHDSTTPHPPEAPPPRKLSSRRFPAHPLHASHKFRVVSPLELLAQSHHSSPSSSSISLLDETAASGEVLVIDTRSPRGLGSTGASASDLALLARAWCADRGENALVGRVGRTCLACCVREARAVGARVVIRV